MQKLASLPWTATRRLVLPSAKRVPTSLDALAARDRLLDREHELKRTNRWRGLAGLAIVFAICAIAPFALKWQVLFIRASHGQDITPVQRADFTFIFVVIDAVLLLLTFPIAVVTKPNSRSDAV